VRKRRSWPARCSGFGHATLEPDHGADYRGVLPIDLGRGVRSGATREDDARSSAAVAGADASADPNADSISDADAHAHADADAVAHSNASSVADIAALIR
jgi:hypothetical protein